MLLKRMTEGVVRRHDQGWVLGDPTDSDPAFDLDPLGEDLEGKRVRVTVEVLGE